jgi:hypothetical protein
VNIDHDLTGQRVQRIKVNSKEICYRASFMKRGLQVKDDDVGNGKTDTYINKRGNTETKKRKEGRKQK